LHFFLFSWAQGGVRGGFFFSFPWFPLCYLLVPNKFPSSTQYVPQLLNVFTHMFSIAPHL
jgi:hypothetical protein